MKEKIHQLKQEGKSDKEIATIVGCHYMTVRYHLYPKEKERNRKSRLESRRTFMKELRLEFGGKCVECGYSDCLEALQFHHKDPNTKLLQISDAIFKKGREEAEKCVLLCANCHVKHHIESGRGSG